MKLRDLARMGAIGLVMTLGLAGPVPAADEMSDMVKGWFAAWDAAFNAKDASGVAALYAEDGRVITGDGNVKQGPAAIQALFQGFMDSGFHDHQLSLEAVDANGDMVYGTGNWKGTGGDGKEYGGKVVNIYERQPDESWKTVLHMWN